MSSDDKPKGIETDTPCPKCNKGVLAVILDDLGRVDQEICSACDFVNKVLEHKLKLETPDKTA